MLRLSKIMCSIIIFSLMVPMFFITPNLQAGLYDEIEWAYTGVRHYPKHRQIAIPSLIEDPFRIRTFVYALDQTDDGLVDIIVALYGIQSIRNAPSFSDFFEETKVQGNGGNYSFAINEASGLEWKDITPANVGTFDNKTQDIYDQIVDKLDSPLVTLPEIWTGSDLRFPVHLVDFTLVVGPVGFWQIIYEDGTLVNGNFTTYGPENPLPAFTNERNTTAYEWPFYNLTVAENVERSSLPRTHSFSVGFPFLSVIISFSTIIAIYTLVYTKRRRKR